MLPVKERVFRPCSGEGEVGFTSQAFRTRGTAALAAVGRGLDGIGMAMGGLPGWAPVVRAGRWLPVVFFHRLAPVLSSAAAVCPSLLVFFLCLPAGLLLPFVRVRPSWSRLPLVAINGCRRTGRAVFAFVWGVTPSPWWD